MRPLHKHNVGIALVLVAIFLVITPIPFLAGPDSNGIFDRVVRFGQAIATPQFIDVSELPVRKTSSVYEIEGVPFNLEAIRNLPYDELEAISTAFREQWVTSKFESSSRVLFDGWNPSTGPMRIPYRYFVLLGTLALLVGIYSMLSGQHQEESGAPINVTRAISRTPSPALPQSMVDLRNSLYAVILGFPTMFVTILFKESISSLGSTGFILNLVFAGVAIWTLVSFFRLCKHTTQWYALWFLLLFVPVLGLGILAGVVYLGFRKLCGNPKEEV